MVRPVGKRDWLHKHEPGVSGIFASRDLENQTNAKLRHAAIAWRRAVQQRREDLNAEAAFQWLLDNRCDPAPE